MMMFWKFINVNENNDGAFLNFPAPGGVWCVQGSEPPPALPCPRRPIAIGLGGSAAFVLLAALLAGGQSDDRARL